MSVTFNILNTDVQLEILEVLQAISPQSLLNVSLCCKNLHDLARSLIYRVISILFTRKRRDTNGRLIQRLLMDSDLSTKVREIRILWAPSANLQHGEGRKKDLELLGKVLPKLTGLKTFVWDAQYPILEWLLHSLYANAPHCQLYTRVPARKDLVRTLSKLHDSPCLYSLDIALSPGDVNAFLRLREAIATSERLKDLAVIWERGSHSLTWHRSLELLSTPLQLRSLELDGPMDFPGIEKPWQLSVAWPTLERFSCTNISFLPNLASQLTGLTSLRLRVGDDEDRGALWTFLHEQCHQLSVLDLTGCTAAINRNGAEIWKHLGKTLISLRIHEDEIPSAFRERPTLSPLQLGILATTCQRLRSLGLDLECPYRPTLLTSEKIPREYQMLDQVADNFWFLEHLEVNVEIDIADQGQFTYARATMVGAGQLWNYLWQQIRSSRVRKWHKISLPRLRSLDVVGGSYRPVSDMGSFLDRSSHWEAAAQQRFHINLSERDDKAMKGIATVTCVELRALQAKLGSREPFRNRQQKVLMDAVTKRARTGPFVRQVPPVLMDREMMRASPFWDRLDERRFYYR